jgi:hypothetical protein
MIRRGHVLYAVTPEGQVDISEDDGDNWHSAAYLISGSFGDISISPNGKIYISRLGAGLFSSSDNGAHWNQFDTTLTGPDVRSVCVASDSEIFISEGYNGLYRSTDAGATWSFNDFQGRDVAHLYRDPAGALYANVIDRYIGGNINVFRSTNDGVTWGKFERGLNGTLLYDFADDGKNVYTCDYNGMFRLADSEWTYVSPGVGFPLVNALMFLKNGTLIAATSNGMFSTVDGGAHWNVYGLVAQCVYTVAENANGELFAGTDQGISSTSDNGATWIDRDTGLHAEVASMAICSDGKIFVGTFGRGMYRSTDNGNTWMSDNHGLPVTYFMGTGNVPIDSNLDVHANSVTTGSDGTIFGSFFDQEGDEDFEYGMYSSTDGGDSWSLFSESAYQVAIDSQGTYYAGDLYFMDGVYRSTDKGVTWSATGLVGESIDCITVNQRGDIFAGTDIGVYHSTDKGITWSSLNSGLETPYASNGMTYVYSFAFDSVGNVYAGTYLMGVYRGFSSTLSGRNINDPGDFTLEQNFPNPVNVVASGTTSFTTRIPVFLNHNEHITVKIYDGIGRYVRTLADGDYPPGPNEFVWDATGAQNGVYYCQMEAEGQIQMKKIIVQR